MRGGAWAARLQEDVLFGSLPRAITTASMGTTVSFERLLVVKGINEGLDGQVTILPSHHDGRERTVCWKEARHLLPHLGAVCCTPFSDRPVKQQPHSSGEGKPCRCRIRVISSAVTHRLHAPSVPAIPLRCRNHRHAQAAVTQA